MGWVPKFRCIVYKLFSFQIAQSGLKLSLVYCLFLHTANPKQKGEEKTSAQKNQVTKKVDKRPNNRRNSNGLQMLKLDYITNSKKIPLKPDAFQPQGLPQ